MNKKFPFSMENIPRQHNFGCLSLKFGCILTALIVILYSLLAISQGFAELLSLKSEFSEDNALTLSVYGLIITIIVVQAVSFLLSAVMLLGALRDKPELIKPWVVFKSLQIIVGVLLFVFFNTMNMINQFADTTIVYYILEFLSLMIRFYMLVLVASYYKQLVEEKEEEERLKELIKGETWYNDA